MKRGTILRASRTSMIAGAAISARLVCASSAFAQGCALCYTDAAATGPHAEAALRHGILILMIPATLIVVGFFALLCRRRNVDRESLEHLPAKVPAASPSAPEIILHLN